MNFYPVRYWWTDRTGEKTASSVASGSTPDDALQTFKRDHPHLKGRAAIINPKPKAKTP